MARTHEIPTGAGSIARFLPLVGEEAISAAEAAGATARTVMAGRVFWNMSAAVRGRSAAESLRSIVAGARGLGIDARWLVIEGTPDFFDVTRRLQHALRGSPGDGSPLGDAERRHYEQVLRANAKDIEGLIRPHDVVMLHDPPTAGLAPHMVRLGAIVIWCCHSGCDQPDEQSDLGWRFLQPYLVAPAALVFSREAYIPAWCDRTRAIVIQPSIDPFSAKNQEMDDATVKAILVHVGLIEGPPGDGLPTFVRADQTRGRVNRRADIARLGRAPTWETPLVVQISAWDPLKDHLGVMQGLVHLVDEAAPAGAYLVLAGPNVNVVADDPEGAAVFDEILAAWRTLSHGARRRIQLASLPMADAEENAAIVNALQRHAAVVVQKSLHESFGLTVMESMWKGRPVVASATGGIPDQITDGVHGLLLADPRDLHALEVAVRRLLEDRGFAEKLGHQAHERIRRDLIGLRHLTQYTHLLAQIAGAPPTRATGDSPRGPVPLADLGVARDALRLRARSLGHAHFAGLTARDRHQT